MDELIQRFPGGMTVPQQWLDLLVPKLPNVPVDMIKHELLTVARDFCVKSGAWRDWLRPLVPDGATEEYGLETGDPNSEVAGVLTVQRQDSGQPLTPVPPELANPPGMLRRGNLPTHYWQTQPDRIFFEPLPAADVQVNGVWQTSLLHRPTLHIFVWLAPIDLCGIPDWFTATHQLAMVQGVMANMLRLPGPNYRPTDAVGFEAKYTSLRASARSRAIGGYNRGAAMLRPPYMARGSQR